MCIGQIRHFYLVIEFHGNKIMKNDIMLSNDAYLRTLWFRIPLEIRQAINNAIEEGKFWVKVEQKADEKDQIDFNKTVDALERLGYTVYVYKNLSENKSVISTTYKILWEEQ